MRRDTRTSRGYRRGVGLADELSYAFPRPNALHRSVRSVAASRPGAWLLARTAPAMDRATSGLTRGRTTLSGALSALPTLVVTTTGRRSGQAREAQLVGIPAGDGIAVVGTNFGQAHTPAWVLNLEADPRATAAYRGRTVEVVAREAVDAERLEVLARAAEVYLGYPRYLRRISGRRVRVIVLERAPAAAS